MKHILLVEDDSNVRKALACVLEIIGYLVTETDSIPKGKKFLEAQAQSFDWVVCDYQHSGGNGLKFLNEVLQDYPKMHCLLISDDVIFGSEPNFGGRKIHFLRKPFGPHKIKEILESEP